LVSDITLQELENAPTFIKDILDLIPESQKEFLFLNEEAIELSQNYINEGIVTMKSLMDARHIAIASTNYVDILASWNFKHIVNYNKIMLYNSVNIKNGYRHIEIRSPRDLSDER
jgi:hypothetical protein